MKRGVEFFQSMSSQFKEISNYMLCTYLSHSLHIGMTDKIRHSISEKTLSLKVMRKLDDILSPHKVMNLIYTNAFRM